ncbi:MAG: hypothetical protein ACK4F7_05145, partial [Inhella sp.]
MRSLFLLALSLWLAIGASAAESTTPVFGAGPRPVQRQGEAIVGVYVLNERGTAAVDQLPPGSASHLLYAFLRLCGPGQLAADASACAGRPDFGVAPDPRHGVFDAAFQRLKARQPGL